MSANTSSRFPSQFTRGDKIADLHPEILVRHRQCLAPQDAPVRVCCPRHAPTTTRSKGFPARNGQERNSRHLPGLRIGLTSVAAPWPRATEAPSRRTRPKRYHHGELPRALLDAALHIASAEGTHGLTLRAVARRAAVSQAAPYRHFANKEAILAAVAEEGFRSLIALIRGAVGAYRDNPGFGRWGSATSTSPRLTRRTSASCLDARWPTAPPEPSPPGPAFTASPRRPPRRRSAGPAGREVAGMVTRDLFLGPGRLSD
jgi:AcrR family transcriptional regulator